jgi:hypothetical protein
VTLLIGLFAPGTAGQRKCSFAAAHGHPLRLKVLSTFSSETEAMHVIFGTMMPIPVFYDSRFLGSLVDSEL